MGFVFIYLFLCLIVAIAGLNRKLGFWGYLFASILLTPLVGIVLVFVSEKRPEFQMK
jgi:hypothetical protein